MKKNRILAVLLCLALAAGLVYGIGRAFAASRRKTVVVIPVTDLNYAWGDYENSMEGMVASGFSQDIYLMDTESVDSVLVETGQHVKEGDVLLKYDATQTSINLERELLSREKLQLQMDVAVKNLATLKKIRPASEEGGGGGGGGFIPDFPIPDDDTPDYSDIDAEEKLDGDTTPYNKEEDTEESPLGTESNPYRYLCSDETVITADFLNKIRQQAQEKSAAMGGSEEAHVPVYCILEVREGNKGGGALKKGWIMDAASLEEAPEGWEGSVNLSGSVKESHSDVSAVDRLDSGSEPYNKDEDSETSPLGSASNPMRFLCTDKAVITGDFLNEMAGRTGADGEGVHYVLEIRDGDRADGSLLVSWQRQGKAEETYEAGKEYVLSFGFAEKENEPEDPGEGEEGGQGEQSGSQDPADPKDPADPGEGQGGTSEGGTEPGGQEPSGQPQEPSGQPEEGGEQGQNTQETEEIVPSGVSADLSRQGNSMSLILDMGRKSRVVFTEAPQGGSLIPSNAYYTKEELEQAKKDAEKEIRDLTLDLRESDLSVKAARKALEEGVVKAQMDGVVGVVNDPANPPTDGSPFLTVVSENGQYIMSALNELYLGTVSEGDTVYMTSYMDGSSFEGTVKSVSPYPDTTGRFSYGSDITYYPMIISVTDPEVVLTEGNYLEVRADQSSAMAGPEDGGKLYVFKAFIQDENGQKYMYKDNDGKLVRQDITIGGMSGESYEVLSGITADDYVAFPYGSSVREGAKTRRGTMDELYQ